MREGRLASLGDDQSGWVMTAIFARPLGECLIFVRPERGPAHSKRHGDRAGHLDRDGYPKIWDPHRRRQVMAHRHIAEIEFDGLDDGAVVHHTCGVRACVNPQHLWPMDRGEHARLHAELRRQRAA